MQEVTSSLVEVQELLTSVQRTDDRLEEVVRLDKAAQNWAAASVRTFRDDLLKRALAISVAIAEFVSELEGSGDGD